MWHTLAILSNDILSRTSVASSHDDHLHDGGADDADDVDDVQQAECVVCNIFSI